MFTSVLTTKTVCCPVFCEEKKIASYLPRKVESYKQLKCRECSQHDQSQEAMSTWMRFWDWINRQFYVDVYIFVWCLVGLWGKVLSSVKVVFFVFGEGSSRPKMIWYHLSCKGKKVFEEQKQLCDRIMCRYFTEVYVDIGVCCQTSLGKPEPS